MVNSKLPPLTSSAQTTITCLACAYCKEPTTVNKRVTADRKVYCGKLCGALGLIRDTHDQDVIDQVTGVEALTTLVEESLFDVPVRIPKKVRGCDIAAALDSLPIRIAIVRIDNDGTPDWIPELKKAKP